MAASTVGRECRSTFKVQDRLGHDGAGGVSRAQEESVVTSLHRHHSLWLHCLRLRLLRPDERAYEFAVHLGSDGVHVNPLVMQEKAWVLDILEPRRFDLE